MYKDSGLSCWMKRRLSAKEFYAGVAVQDNHNGFTDLCSIDHDKPHLTFDAADRRIERFEKRVCTMFLPMRVFVLAEKHSLNDVDSGKAFQIRALTTCTLLLAPKNPAAEGRVVMKSSEV